MQGLNQITFNIVFSFKLIHLCQNQENYGCLAMNEDTAEFWNLFLLGCK